MPENNNEKTTIIKSVCHANTLRANVLHVGLSSIFKIIIELNYEIMIQQL